MLQPLPLADPSRLMLVGEIYDGAPQVMSVGNYVDTNAAVPDFEHGLSALNYANFNLADETTPERVVGARVTANYFDVMGVRPAIGRTFTADEDGPGNDRVVVLSHRLWQRRFGASAAVVGRDAADERRDAITIAGVMPESFDLTTDSEELWTPIAFTPTAEGDARRALPHDLRAPEAGRHAGSRCRRSSTPSRCACAAISRKTTRRSASATVPFAERFVGDYRQRLLDAARGGRARAADRLRQRRQPAARARRGARARDRAAHRARRRASGESSASCSPRAWSSRSAPPAPAWCWRRGFIAGVIAWSPTDVPRLDQARIDPVALGFAVAIALVSSVLCGLAPALRLSRRDVQTGAARRRTRRRPAGCAIGCAAALIVAEVALSLLLLVGAGLLIRSAIALQRTSTGFEPRGVLSARVTLPATGYAEPARIVETLRRIDEQARAIPGVFVGRDHVVRRDGRRRRQQRAGARGKDATITNSITSTLRIITPGFFPTMGVPIVKGRNFDDADRAGGQVVMIVSGRLAARAFPGQDPIGKRIAAASRGRPR